MKYQLCLLSLLSIAFMLQSHTQRTGIFLCTYDGTRSGAINIEPVSLQDAAEFALKNKNGERRLMLFVRNPYTGMLELRRGVQVLECADEDEREKLLDAVLREMV